MCNALNGGLVQLMVRFGNTTDFTTKFPRLWFSVESVPTAGYGFLRTPDVGLSGRKLEAMGTVAIPPTLPGLSGDTAYNLKLFGYSSEAVNVDLDYVQLFPVEAFRSYQMSQRNWIASGDWQDDGYRVFVESSSNVFSQILVPSGAPLEVVPGQDQRFYFLFDEFGAMVITREFTAKMFYRPRVLTLGV
jgi:hypothetical protein